MIRVYTKTRHISKISEFLSSINLKHEVFTTKKQPTIQHELESFELGISYCYPRKIKEPLLSIPLKGFINYHPGPLPKYKGPKESTLAISNKETNWGVTVHYMGKDYDTGKIIKVNKFKLHEPPISEQELGAVSHYFLFNLFKETILDIFNLE
jgi:methionyl-tRNA formyltransferase